MSTQSERVKTILNRLMAIASDEEEAESMSGPIEEMLDSLAQEDFFGTEQQCDPRGDFRDEEWSVFFVHGVDSRG